MNTLEISPESGRRFQVVIDEQAFQIGDPVVTGRQLLDVAGMRPADQFIILQFLPDGLLEEIRLEETTNLRESGVEKFITFHSDRSFRFTIDGREFEWGAPTITGRTLKKLAGVEFSTFDVWQEVPMAQDKKIDNRAEANLEGKGTERFFTAKKTTTEG
jgi:hypothetical protein